MASIKSVKSRVPKLNRLGPNEIRLELQGESILQSKHSTE